MVIILNHQQQHIAMRCCEDITYPNRCFLLRKPMAADAKVRRICVIIAMKAEAAPFADELGLQEPSSSFMPKPLPAQVFSGTLADESNTEVYVVHNGTSERHGVDHIGSYMSVLSTYAVCQHLQPDIVITAGTAGGFAERGGVIGDTYLASEFRCHDSRIPLEGFDKYGECAITATRTENLRVALKLKEGVCSTGSSLDCTEMDIGLLRKHRACAKDMEGAAVAFVADLFHMPIMGLKTITDIVDGARPSGALPFSGLVCLVSCVIRALNLATAIVSAVTPEHEFSENLHTAAHALRETLKEAVHFLAGKPLSEL